MPRKGSAAENKKALAELKALSGPPGSPPGALPGRVHGRYAKATVDGITLHLFEWEVTFDLETFDATAHGEVWKTFVPGDQSWTARARGYFTASVAAYLKAAAVAAADPPLVTFKGFRGILVTGDTGFDAANDTVWEGTGYITRANFSVPMAMVTQEIEIQGSGAPIRGA